jgi:uncharacterized membrane protein
VIRNALIRSGRGRFEDFQWRSTESSRVEELTDAVIGFALTLLVVSLEVPRTFDQLMVIVRDFPGFAISFAILIAIWYEHYKFFRRYALQSQAIIALNAILLFQIVFYMFPLKFLFILSTRSMLGGSLMVAVPGNGLVSMIETDQLRTLIYLFGVGWTAVWFIFTLMYREALREREALRLNELEVFHTRISVIENLIGASFGIVSMLIVSFIAMPAGFSLASLIYLALFPISWIMRLLTEKERRALRLRLVESAPDPSENDAIEERAN